MKKFIFIAILANLFYSCQSLSPLGNNGTKSYNIGLNAQVEKDKELNQESFFLSDTGIAYFLDIVSGNIKNNVTRSYLEGDAVDIYLGEYVTIPTGAYNVSVLTTPKEKSYEAFIRGGFFYFRSLYQGKYGFSLEKYGEPAQTIVINNKSRYRISAFDLNNLILKNAEERDLGKLKNSVQAFKILFPENPKIKEVSMILFNQAVMNNDKQLVTSESNFLDENFELSPEEKIKLVLGKEKILQNDYILSQKYLTFSENGPELNEIIKNNIIKRGKPTNEELVFLEEYYANESSRELADALGVFYFRNGNIDKGTHYSENKMGILPKPLKDKLNTYTDKFIKVESKEVDKIITGDLGNSFEGLYQSGLDYYETESYAEAILVLEKAKQQIKEDSVEGQGLYYLLGNSYYLTNNFDKAQENFEKITKGNQNYPEITYKLGDIAFRKGNKNKAEKIFNNISTEYSSTIWGRRSIIYLRRIK